MLEFVLLPLVKNDTSAFTLNHQFIMFELSLSEPQSGNLPSGNDMSGSRVEATWQRRKWSTSAIRPRGQWGWPLYPHSVKRTVGVPSRVTINECPPGHSKFGGGYS